MKKVVVVVDGHDRMVFTGDDIDVIDGTSNAGLDNCSPVKLVIRDDKKTIAVFKDWVYWKEITKATENNSEYTSVKKILVRPKKLISAAMWKRILDNLEKCIVVPLPSDLDIIIIYKSGETKIL